MVVNSSEPEQCLPADGDDGVLGLRTSLMLWPRTQDKVSCMHSTLSSGSKGPLQSLVESQLWQEHSAVNSCGGSKTIQTTDKYRASWGDFPANISLLRALPPTSDFTHTRKIWQGRCFQDVIHTTVYREHLSAAEDGCVHDTAVTGAILWLTSWQAWESSCLWEALDIIKMRKLGQVAWDSLGGICAFLSSYFCFWWAHKWARSDTDGIPGPACRGC